MVWREKVAQSSTLNQAGDWTLDLMVGSQEILAAVTVCRHPISGQFFVVQEKKIMSNFINICIKNLKNEVCLIAC